MSALEEASVLVAAEVLAERRRQQRVEGWTPEHDDEHEHAELALAAACYAIGAPDSELWPWEPSDWKPKSRREDLVRAAALLVAEIERLDRAARLFAEVRKRGFVAL